MTTDPDNSLDIWSVTSILYEQLEFLTERFNNLTGDDNCDCEEANVKLADTTTNLKYTSLLKKVDELVSNGRILIQYLILFFILIK